MCPLVVRDPRAVGFLGDTLRGGGFRDQLLVTTSPCGGTIVPGSVLRHLDSRLERVMPTRATRPTSMLFTRPLSIESTLPVPLARARVRACATKPYVADLEAFRRRQIIGWRLSEATESLVFQPEYGDTLNVDGARF